MSYSTQEKVIPPITLSLKRNKNVPLCFFFRRDFSLPLLRKPMMRLQHRQTNNIKIRKFSYYLSLNASASLIYIKSRFTCVD